MYKGTANSLRRKTRVHLVDYEATARVGTEDDYIISASNMDLAECLEERRKLLTEKTRAENELLGAKREGNWGEQRAIGSRLQGYASRLGILGGRMKQLNRQQSDDDLFAAMKELLDHDTIGRIVKRVGEIKLERESRSIFRD